MATREQDLIEANNRGLLKGEIKIKFDKAVKLGLIKFPADTATAPADKAPPATEQSYMQQAQQIPGAIGEMFTGNERATDQTRELPELFGSSILTGEDFGDSAAITPALLTATDPNEIVSIITSKMPNIGVTYNKDGQGNVYPVLRNNETGAVAQVNRPGVSALDVIQGLGIASLFTPATGAGLGMGALKATGAVMGATGATSAANEAYQASQGGDFSAQNVALDTITGGIGEGIPQLIRGRGQSAQASSDVAQQNFADAEAARMGGPLSPEALQAQLNDSGRAIVNAVEGKPKNQGTLITEATQNINPDQRMLRSAADLGVLDDLSPADSSTNQPFIEIVAALESVIGSQGSAKRKVLTEKMSQNADDLITEFGGSIDKAEVSDRFSQKMAASIKSLGSEAEVYYDDIVSSIPVAHPVNANGLINMLEAKAKQLGGENELSELDTRILRMARKTGGPTYALLDSERKKIGQTIGKVSGPYDKEETSSLKAMYSALTDTQEKALIDLNPELGNKWSIAKNLWSQKATLQENSVKLLGKELTGSVMTRAGSAVKSLGSGNFKAFDELISQLPKNDRKEIVMTALNDVFTAGSRKEQSFSAPGFVDWMGSLQRNKAARNRLYKNMDKQSVTRLHNLYRVAKGMRRTSSNLITTGKISDFLKNFGKVDGTVSRLYQVGTRVAAAEGVTTAAGLPGAGAVGVLAGSLSKDAATDPITKLADNLLSSPEFLRAAQMTAGNNAGSAKALALANAALAKSERAQRWVRALPPNVITRIGEVGIMTYLSEEPALQQEQQ